MNKIPVFELFGTSHAFGILSRKSGQFCSELFARVYKISFPEKTNFCLNNPLVERASAMLLVTYVQHCTKCMSQHFASVCYWQFHLDKHLDLNVTFLLINFYLENLSCHNARVKMNKIIFCGIYTSFNVYPNHHNVSIEVHSTKCFYFQVHAKFILMDFSLLKTGDLIRHFSEIPPFDTVTLLKINTTVQLFLVEVKKNTLALVHTLNICELIVYDGPNVHANRVTPENDLYQISTFQCFVVTKGSISKCVVSYTQNIANILVYFVKQSLSLTPTAVYTTIKSVTFP